MSEVAIINDAKFFEKETEGETNNNEKDNNSIKKINNQYKSDNSEDKDINSKTISTEAGIKNNSKNEENYENLYPVTTSKKK
jgi:hypothetical protein